VTQGISLEWNKKCLKNILKGYWDIILVFIVAMFIFSYNLHGWRVMTVEEWQFYRDFGKNWLEVYRVHSFYIPSYILIYLLPASEFFTLRYFTAFLVVLGILFLHLAVKHVTNTKAALLVSALAVTDTWFLYYGRQFLWIWSAITLGALAIYLTVRFKDKSTYLNSVITGIGVLNFSQTVFFAFPFLLSHYSFLREKLDYRKIAISLVIFFLIVLPSIWLFTQKQDQHLEIQSPEHNALIKEGLEGTQVPLQYELPVIGYTETTLVFDPANMFTQLRNRIGYNRHDLYDLSHIEENSTFYNILTLILLIYPLYLYKFSANPYRSFFVIGALSAFTFHVVFPFLNNLTYLWTIALFMYPCLAIGFASKSKHLKIISLALIFTLVAAQGLTSHQHIITYDYEQNFQNAVEDSLTDLEHLYLEERAYNMLKHSELDLLGDQNYEVKSCKELEPIEGFKLTADACSLDNEIVAQPRWLILYR